MSTRPNSHKVSHTHATSLTFYHSDEINGYRSKYKSIMSFKSELTAIQISTQLARTRWIEGTGKLTSLHKLTLAYTPSLSSTTHNELA